MFIAKKVIVALATALLVGPAIAAAPTKYTTAGYNAYAWAYYDSCSANDGSYFDVSIYSSQSKTKSAGNNKVSTDGYESLYLSFSFVTSCSGDTVNYLTGSAYEWSYSTKPTFTIESKKLTSASIKNAQVPLISYSCTYSCYEVCYADWWGSTCPPEPTYTECAPTCTYPEDAGVATVSVNWSDNSNTALSQNSYSYRSKNSDGFYAYRGKGSSRYVTSVTISAVKDGASILPGAASWVEGSLSSTSEMSIGKYAY